MPVHVARFLLATTLPFLCPQPSPSLLGPAFIGLLSSRPPPALAISQDSSDLLAALSVTSQHNYLTKACPQQGGQRITEEWLHELPTADCIWRFRLSADEIVEMAERLQIPEKFVTTSRYSFTSVEALSLLCARFRTAGDIHALAMLYDRCQSSITECINELVVYLDELWKHLLNCDSAHLLHPERLSEYAAAIHRRGSPLTSIFGFIDCTIRRICRPTWWQRQAYSGHKKHHALKYQAIMLPNGIVGHLFGPFEGRRNDMFLLNESNLLQRLATFAFRPDVPPNAPIQQRTFQIFGDPAYGVGLHIISPFAGAGDRTEDEKEWNAQMSSVRIEVEHGFGIIVKLWPFLNAFWKMQLYSSPVGRYYRVGVLLANCVNCLRPNQVAQYFACFPPTLEEYLHN